MTSWTQITSWNWVCSSPGAVGLFQSKVIIDNILRHSYFGFVRRILTSSRPPRESSNHHRRIGKEPGERARRTPAITVCVTLSTPVGPGLEKASDLTGAVAHLRPPSTTPPGRLLPGCTLLFRWTFRSAMPSRSASTWENLVVTRAKPGNESPEVLAEVEVSSLLSFVPRPSSLPWFMVLIRIEPMIVIVSKAAIGKVDQAHGGGARGKQL